MHRTAAPVIVMSLVVVACAASAVAQDWSERAPAPTPRWNPASTVMDGRVYVIGGQEGTAPYRSSRVVEVYDPAADSWSTGAPMPTDRWGLAAAAVDGRVYAIGGFTGSFTGGFSSTAVVEVFDPAANSWSTASSMPTPRGWAGSAVDGVSVLVLGGYDSTVDETVATVERFDTVSGRWTSETSMPIPRNWQVTATVGRKLYSIGGFDYGPSYSDLVQEYDLDSGIWATRRPMPTPRLASGIGVWDDAIYVVGGRGGHSDEVEVYFPAADTWKKLAPLPTAREGMTVEVLGGTMYVIAGSVPLTQGGTPYYGLNEAADLAAMAPIPPYSVWLPIVAHVAGFAGSEWRTDLVARNPTTDDALVEMVLYAGDGVQRREATIAGNRQAVFEDVVGLFGASDKGALEVRSFSPVDVSGRIYNQAPAGTFGQYLWGCREDEALRTGDTVWLLGLRQQQGLFRSNISVTNTDDSALAVARCTLFGNDGDELAAYNLLITPGAVLQDLEPFRERAGRSDLGWGYAEVRIASGSGVLVMASVVDSRTNDATTIPAVRGFVGEHP